MSNIKFESFEVNDTKGINRFLEEYGKGLANDSTAYAEGRICFLYQKDPLPMSTEKEGQKAFLLTSLNKYICEREAELIGADLDEQYYRSLSISDGSKDWAKEILEKSNHKRNLLKQLRICGAVREKIKKGTWISDMS